MATGVKSQNDSTLDNPIEAASTPTKIAEPSSIDPQVKIKKRYSPRRSFSAAHKLRILTVYNACESPSERGALLRREGLYYSRIGAWNQELANGTLTGNKKRLNAVLRTDHLVRENEQLKKKLAQVEAIIEIQKKVSELLGMHILLPENTEVKS
jgi:transposase